LASDISNIIRDELVNTLQSLLSKETKIVKESEFDSAEFEGTQAIFVSILFEYKEGKAKLDFLIPTVASTKFEYYMLGGMVDLKDAIDDETLDAVREIVSNVCGSICTSVNAQEFPELGKFKFNIEDIKIVSEVVPDENCKSFSFMLNMADEEFPLVLSFGEKLLPFIGSILGEEVAQPSADAPIVAGGGETANSNPVLDMLGEESVDNLKLLFNIKLKLSVRLGTKILLLKDILKWDIGEIIELEQMVNEPLDVLVNGVKIGEGEAVVVDGKFGLKIRSIGNTLESIEQFT
jgi:flagellar motor switch protein FliN/FliY